MQNLFLHFKGGRYRFLHIAKTSEDQAEVVVYLSLDDRTIWVRPMTEWSELTNRWTDGVSRPRFCPEHELPEALVLEYKTAALIRQRCDLTLAPIAKQGEEAAAKARELLGLK